MMKKHLLLLPCVLFTVFSLSAATTNWLGGNGPWNNPARWDTGTVPGLLDSVVISSGKVGIPSGYAATARYVSVESGAFLRLQNNSSLTLIGAEEDAFLNAGSVKNEGSVTILDVDSGHGLNNTGTWLNEAGGFLSVSSIYRTAVWNYGGTLTNHGTITVAGDVGSYALENEGELVNHSTGTIDLEGGESSGLSNIPGPFSTGRLLNHGTITISDSERHGVRNYTPFKNKGHLNITGCLDDGIKLYANLENDASGIITIEGSQADSWAAGIGISSGDTLDNAGQIQISNYPSGGQKGIDFFFSGVLLNRSGAEMIIANSYFGMDMWSSGAVLDNVGVIRIQDSPWQGLNYRGSITNHSGAEISITGSYSYGMSDIGIGGFLQNEGFIDIESGDLNLGLNLGGTWYNQNCGKIAIDGKLSLSTGCLFYNDSWLKVNGTNHLFDGDLVNNGAIENTNGDIDPADIANLGLMIRPLDSLGAVGVPIPDAIEIGSNGPVSVIGWYINPGLNLIAGTYDATLNEFTPNLAAVDDSELYVVLEDNVLGCRDTMTVLILDAQPNNESNALAASKMSKRQIYPNPVSRQRGRIHLSNSTDIALLRWYDGRGQLIQQQTGGTGRQIPLPAGLTSGWYVLALHLTNGTIERQPLLIVE